MSNLRKARSAKVDRQLRRAQRAQERAATGRRARSSSIASDEPPSSEEGEISRDWREQSPRHAREVKSEREDLDALPSSVVDVNSARLSRYELVEMMFKDGFEEAISGKCEWSGQSDCC
jgi:RNA polymerase-associated protein RTF1